MKSQILALGALALSAACPLGAQSVLPQLFVDASPRVQPLVSLLTVRLDGRFSAPYVILFDVSSGSQRVLGEEIRLGLTPQLTTLASGFLPSAGRELLSFPIPLDQPNLLGVPFYFQAATVDPQQRNTGLRLSNGESTILRGDLAIVERFDLPRNEGYTGNFDRTSRHALRGTATRRTVRTADPTFVPFGAPVIGPLSESGARVQNVFRAVDLQATGEPELLTAIRWRAYGGVLTSARFDRLDLALAHTDTTPDYTIDPFSSLPSFPNSGLDEAFAQNLATARDSAVVRSGAYAIAPGDLRADGYVDYQLARPFRYNGLDSLLLDFRTRVNARPGPPVNGQFLQLAVPSSPNPFARVAVAGGTRQNPGPVFPDQVRTGNGDNGVMDYQFEFSTLESEAISPFRPARVASPDYQQPVAATLLRGNSQVVFEFRGADDVSGAGATAFSTDINSADGKPWLQIRVLMIADPVTLEVPEVDTLVVPIR